MDCQRLREVLSAVVDGEATPDEEAAVERHLAHCPACRIADARMTAISRRLRVRPAVPCRASNPGRPGN